MLATACGHANILQDLLAQPYINVYHLDIEQHTVLWYAVHRGQVECVQILLSSDFDLDINRGMPSCLAAPKVWGRPQYGEIMSLLLSQSQRDPNCELAEGNDPPWFILAIRWEFDLLRRLLHRPDFDPWRWTPPVKLWQRFTVFMADTDYDYFLGDKISNKKAADLPAIFMMLDADERFCLPEFEMLYLMWPFIYYAFGKDIKYKDEGHTYSYEIGWMLICDDTRWTWRDILRRSLEANHLSFYAKDSKNRGFIHSLAYRGKDEFLQAILQEGVAVDDMDKLGRTALHYAASNGHKGACDILINAGASPHSIDNDGQTILHVACSSGKLDIVNKLIELGADVYAKDRYGSTTLHFASMAEEGSEIIELLVRVLGLDLNTLCKKRSTPLHCAVSNNSLAVVSALLDLGADPNICGNSGTALSNAIFKAAKPIAERLALVTDLDILDCLGTTSRSQLPLLFKDQRVSETDRGHTEPTIPSVQRDVVLSYLRKRLNEMVDGHSCIRTKLFYGTGVMLLELGDEVSAQIMLEYAISPFSHINALYWPELWCCNCLKEYGYLYLCMTCPYVGSVVFCENCKGTSKLEGEEVLQCVGHEFLQLPSKEWQHFRKGTVNAEGETFDEFLKSLLRKYDDESILELLNLRIREP